MKFNTITSTLLICLASTIVASPSKHHGLRAIGDNFFGSVKGLLHIRGGQSIADHCQIEQKISQ
ncbi:hypothetical protein K502DRAFT_354023, partial [Neoconidiobolus thromboides FSU 785]